MSTRNARMPTDEEKAKLARQFWKGYQLPGGRGPARWVDCTEAEKRDLVLAWQREVGPADTVAASEALLQQIATLLDMALADGEAFTLSVTYAGRL